MTDFEFEKLLSEALSTKYEPSEQLNKKISDSIKIKPRFHYGQFISVAAAVVIIAGGAIVSWSNNFYGLFMEGEKLSPVAIQTEKNDTAQKIEEKIVNTADITEQAEKNTSERKKTAPTAELRKTESKPTENVKQETDTFAYSARTVDEPVLGETVMQEPIQEESSVVEDMADDAAADMQTEVGISMASLESEASAGGGINTFEEWITITEVEIAPQKAVFSLSELPDDIAPVYTVEQFENEAWNSIEAVIDLKLPLMEIYRKNEDFEIGMYRLCANSELGDTVYAEFEIMN